jgi:hypothetical protein
MAEANAPVVIVYARFREAQERRGAVTAALKQPERPSLSPDDAFVVHVEAASASLRPLNRKPC